MFKYMMIFLLGFAAAGAASASTIVQNGSFEDGSPGLTSPNWGIYGGGLPGWTTTNGGVEVQTAGTLGLTPYDGNKYIEMDGYTNYTISQTLALQAGRYALSFAYSPRTWDAATNGVAYSLGSLASGSITGPGGPFNTSVGAWTLVTAFFTVTSAGSYNLNFAGIGASDGLGGLLDAVQVAAVPVPAGGLLLAGGLAGIAALRRRKRA